MHTLKRSALVPYNQRQMFELVNDIEEYERFLPWCRSSKIISRTDTEIIATLEASWKGMSKSFTTRNKLYPYERMEMTLVNGPLQHLEGIWDFIALDKQACKISLDMEFAFTGAFVDMLFQPIFQHIANTFVDAFVQRAKDLYGE